MCKWNRAIHLLALCTLMAALLVSTRMDTRAAVADRICLLWTCQGTGKAVNGNCKDGNGNLTDCTMDGVSQINGCFPYTGKTCNTTDNAGVCPGTIPNTNPPLSCSCTYVWCNIT